MMKLTEYRSNNPSQCSGSVIQNGVTANTCCNAKEGYPCISQVGRGQNQTTDPLYIWNNSAMSGINLVNVASECSGAQISTYIQASRDYFIGSTPKPGYTPYIYPHPLSSSDDDDNDGIPNAVEIQEGTNPLVKDNDVFGNARLFTMQQYRDFLSREGDPPGITGWTNVIVAGTYSRLDVINGFFNSVEFDGVVAPVVRLYFALFLRVPDYSGLIYNVGLIKNGSQTLRSLADFFTARPEFQATYGSLNDTQFVTLLYNNVLGRAPDTAGLNGWVSLLQSGYTRGQVMIGFSESVEYKAKKFNEVYVTMMYVGMLRRSPELGGYNGWLAYLNTPGNTPLTMINGFFLSTEYHNRFLP
jgi:hypothetical protein